MNRAKPTWVTEMSEKETTHMWEHYMAHISEEENKKAMQNALDAAKADLQEAPWCLAAWLGGSFATGKADAWADLDFRTVVAAEHYENILARRYEIPRAWGDVVYEEGVPGRIWAIVHCRPFFKIDIYYYRKEDLARNPHWLLPAMIIHDRHGIFADAVRCSRELPADADQRSLSYLKTKAVATAEEVRRKLLRRQPLYVHSFLTELRDWIVRIHQCNTGADRRENPLKYLECVAPAELREALLASDHGMSFRGLEMSLKDLGTLVLNLLDETDEQLKLALRITTDW